MRSSHRKIGLDHTAPTAILILLLGSGCGSGRPPPETGNQPGPGPEIAEPEPEPPAPVVEEPEAPLLQLVGFRMGDHRGDDVILRDDGQVYGERADRVLGTVHADGRYVDAQGNPVATLRPDGTIERQDGSLFEVRVTPEGTLRHRRRPDLEIRLHEDGSIVGVDLSQPDSPAEETYGTVEGYTPEAQRVALYVLALMSELLGSSGQ